MFICRIWSLHHSLISIPTLRLVVTSNLQQQHVGHVISRSLTLFGIRNISRKYSNTNSICRLFKLKFNFRNLNKTRTKNGLLLSAAIFSGKQLLISHQPNKFINNSESPTVNAIKSLNNFKFKIWLFLHCFWVFLICIPIFILYPVTLVIPSLKLLWIQLIFYALQYSGPVILKLGQWASTRRDIFSPELCNRLSKLQQNTNPHSWNETVKILENSFGKNWQEFFTFKSTFPVASGCVAQVYKAYLKKTKLANSVDTENLTQESDFTNAATEDLPIAIKVLHPGIYEQFVCDLILMRLTAKLFKSVYPKLYWISLVECVEEFGDFMLSQLDLLHEAGALQKFQKNFENYHSIKFPQPIAPWVTKDVLVETWEEGEPISRYLTHKDENVKSELAHMGIAVLLKMIFSDNFVHGDMHPGNILVKKVKPNPFSSTNSYELIFVDCGLHVSMSKQDYENFNGVFKAVIFGRCDDVGDLFLKNSIHLCQEPEDFKHKMAELIREMRKKTLNLNVVDIGILLNKVFSLLMSHKVKLEKNFASVIIAVMILEGLGRSLDPSINILEEAKRFLL